MLALNSDQNSLWTWKKQTWLNIIHNILFLLLWSFRTLNSTVWNIQNRTEINTCFNPEPQLHPKSEDKTTGIFITHYIITLFHNFDTCKNNLYLTENYHPAITDLYWVIFGRCLFWHPRVALTLISYIGRS